MGRSQDRIPGPGKVLLFGSGETAASAQQAYHVVFSSLSAVPQVAILETPAGFELNSEWVAGQVAQYLQEHLQNFQPRTRLVPARAGFDERGLLDVAFHPDFAANGRFFVFYSAPTPPDHAFTFEEIDLPLDNNDFTYNGTHFTVGSAGDTGNPILTASAPNAYRVSPGQIAFIEFPQPVSYVTLFFVHRAGDTPSIIQAIDADNIPRGGAIATDPL